MNVNKVYSDIAKISNSLHSMHQRGDISDAVYTELKRLIDEMYLNIGMSLLTRNNKE